MEITDDKTKEEKINVNVKSLEDEAAERSINRIIGDLGINRKSS